MPAITKPAFNPKVGEGNIITVYFAAERGDRYKLFSPDSKIRDVIEWAWNQSQQRFPQQEVAVTFAPTTVVVDGKDMETQ